MVSKIKSCVFISGRGTNLNYLIKSSRDYNFPINIDLIISNNKNAKGLKLAKTYNIPCKVFPGKDFEIKSLHEIKEKKIKFLCLAGFMKILSSNFIKSFHHPILNIHPSLLPKYRGLNTHKRVLQNKEKYSGCTVHFVTKNLDHGKIIMQKKVLISKNETINSLEKKILKQEHKLYSESIRYLFK